MRKNPTIQKLFTTEDENAPHQESNSIVEDSTRTSCSSADISDTFGEEKNHHVNQKQPKKFQRKISSSANSNNQRLINSKISSKATPTNFFGKAVEPAQSVLVSDAAPTPLDKIPESNVTLNTENSNSTNNTENTKFPSNSVPRVDETHSQQVFEPLPPGWMQGCTDDGRIYFYHTIARISRWNPPTQDVVIAVEERLNKTHSAAEEAISVSIYCYFYFIQ